MPNPACSTSFDGCRRPAETTDQPSVARSATKTWVMAELEAGTDIYFKAFIAKQTDTQLRLRFPGECAYCAAVRCLSFVDLAALSHFLPVTFWFALHP